jgi:hypothetical protein
MTSSPNPTADAEEWIDEALADFNDYSPEFKTTKQAILNHITTHYLPREQVEQIIGEDEWIRSEHDELRNLAGRVRNHFRAEQRKRLHPNQSTSKENK